MRRLLAFTATAVAFAAPAIACAQEPAHDQGADVRRADSLFDAGKALLDGGQYADACAKFAESKRLAVGLGVTLYLADCYERIGRTASAWTEFRSAEGLARQRGDKRADVARDRALALEPKLDRLTIAVAPTLPRADLQVLRDGAFVPPEEWGVAMPVDPGDHVVVASAPGRAQRSFSAHVGAEATTATVRVDRLEDAPGATVPPLPVATQAVTPPPAAPAGDGGHADWTRRWIGVGVGGAGVVGVALGAVFGLEAKSKLDQSNAGPCDATDHCTEDGLGMRQDASSAARVATVAFAAGAVAIGAGIVIYVTAPRGEGASAVGLAPMAVPGGGGALIRGAF
jgi:hypothetical protein